MKAAILEAWKDEGLAKSAESQAEAYKKHSFHLSLTNLADLANLTRS